MVRCHCWANGSDPNCGTGWYLTGKLKGINAVIAVKGFLDLSDYTRQRVLGEYQHWLDEWHKHVQEGSDNRVWKYQQ